MIRIGGVSEKFVRIISLFERNFRYKEQQRVTYKINFF